MTVKKAIDTIDKTKKIEDLLNVALEMLGGDLTRNEDTIAISPQMAIEIADIMQDYRHFIENKTLTQ